MTEERTTMAKWLIRIPVADVMAVMAILWCHLTCCSTAWPQSPSPDEPDAAFQQDIDIGIADQSQLIYRPHFDDEALDAAIVDDLNIEAIRVHLRKTSLDNRPQLLYEFVPFFDLMVARIINVGWGPESGSGYRLIDERITSADGQHRVKDLLDLVTNYTALARVNRSSTHLFPLGKNYVPFSVAASMPFDVNEMKKPTETQTLSRRFAWIDRNNSFAAVPIQPGNDEHYKYSGVASFTGQRFRQNTHSRVSYYLRTFASFECPGDHPLPGALMTQWSLLFGNRRAVTVQGGAAAAYAGVMVDLGNFDQTDIICHAGVHFDAREPGNLNFIYLASRSGSFVADVYLRYRIGNGRLIERPAKVGVSGYIYAPRTIDLDLGYSGTTVFLSQLRALDPGLNKRAREWIESALTYDQPQFDQLVGDIHYAWQYAHAVMICLDSDDETLRALALRLLARVSEKYVKNASVVNCFSTESNELFALLCKYQPDKAVSMALDCYQKSRFLRPLQFCYLVPESRKYAKAQESDLREALDANLPSWTGDEIIFAALFGSRRGITLLCEAINPSFSADVPRAGVTVPDSSKAPMNPASHIPFAYHAAATIVDDEMDATIETILSHEEFLTESVSGIIKGLTNAKNRRHARNVISICRRAIDAKADSTLLECIEYFEQVPTPGIHDILSDLSEFRESASVRNRAIALAKKYGS